MKENSSFSYESQIKLSLLFLILFLVLINFGTLYLLGKTRTALEKEHQAKLKAASTLVGILLQKGREEALPEALAELALSLHLDRIVITDKNQKILASSSPTPHPELESGADPAKESALIHEFPIFDPKAEEEVFVRIVAKGGYLTALNKISTLDAVFRGIGVLLALFLAFVLINAILRPYRQMRKKAEGFRTGPDKHDQGVDFVVNVFSNTIEELRHKEKLLQELYKNSEKKAEELSYFNQYILRSISSGVIICDLRGKIVSFNSAAQKIAGYRSKDVKGKNYAEVFQKGDLFFGLLEDIFKNQKIHSGIEAEFVRKNGKKVSLGISSSFIKDDKKKKLGAVLFFTDMTDLKTLQKEMALREKMASLGEMSAGLAHELRNSMSTIWGFGKLLKKSLESNHPLLEVVDMIIKESQATEEMLQRFLAFARPIELVLGEVTLKHTLQESLGALRENQNHIKLNLVIQEDLPSISADPLLLRQCFQNVIQNSIDAMPQGGELSIVVERSRDSGAGTKEEDNFAVVEITDTGEGIPEDEFGKIFLPFFSSKEKGVGLGLSLVRKIIDLHQGRIEVQSKQKIGTTFRIYLPLKSQKVAARIK